MRVLFTSDWQIGAGRSLGDGEHGPGSRFHDQCDALDRIRAIAVEERCGLVAVLGDVFQHSRPAPHEILAVQRFVRSLLADNIRCLFIQGNHDSRGSALPTALEIFAEHGCVVALLPSIHAVDDVVVATLPWTPPGAIVAAMPDVRRDDVNDRAAQGLAHAAKVLHEQATIGTPDAKKILVGHWSVSGAALPTGLDTSHLREPVVPLDALLDCGFDLVALGHIHKAQVLSASPVAFYCGSPMVHSWGEAGDQHGVWVYDSDGAGSLRFLEVEDNRRFVTLEPTFVDFGAVGVGFSEPPGDVVGAVVRVRYTVDEAMARRIDRAKVSADLLELGATKVILDPTVVREVRARVANVADDLSEQAALEMWIREQGVNGSEADALRVAHAAYLERLR